MTWPRWLTPERRRVLRRSSKIALAAVLATAIARALRLPNPWFATLAALVAVEITLQASIRSARNALIGAAVGALFGLGVAMVAKDQVWAVGFTVLVALAVGGWFRLERVGRQAAIVATVIVLVPETAVVSTQYFAWIRFSETVIGIGAALAVNALVLPPRAYRGARRNLAAAYVELAAMYRLVVEAEATGERDSQEIVTARRSFRAQMRAVDSLWDEAISEHPPVDLLAPHWRSTTRRIWEQCTAMDDAVMDASARGRLNGARSELSDLAAATAEALDEVARTLASLEAVPDCHELTARRHAMLDRLASLESETSSLPFTEALQVFTFVNSMSTVAARLTELAVADPAGAARDPSGS